MRVVLAVIITAAALGLGHVQDPLPWLAGGFLAIVLGMTAELLG
jgi:hypothetical protein